MEILPLKNSEEKVYRLFVREGRFLAQVTIWRRLRIMSIDKQSYPQKWPYRVRYASEFRLYSSPDKIDDNILRPGFSF